MTRYQTSIIWLGLILITLNIIVNLGTFKSVLFGGPGGNGNGSPNPVTPPNRNPPLAPGMINPIIGNNPNQQTPNGIMV